MFKIAIAFALLPAAPAMAFDQAFLGTWAPDASSCGFADSTSRFTISPKKFSGREFACNLKRASKAGTAWRMQYSCVGEGEDYNMSFKWRLGKNGHLLEQGRDGPQEYIRCADAATKEAATKTDNFAGKYAGRQQSYKWTASIIPAGRQTYKIKVSVGSTMPACVGEIEAVGQLKSGRIVTQPEKDDTCTLTISKTRNGIAVEENDCSADHGMACGFDSSMKKVAQ